MKGWLPRVAAAVLVLLAALAVVGSRGTYDLYPRQDYADPAKRPSAPGWVSVCADTPHLSWLSCGRVAGRVAWIQRGDSDGDGDVHFAVISRLRVRIVKIQRKRHITAPGVGDRITASGPVFRGQSGRYELNAIVLR